VETYSYHPAGGIIDKELQVNPLYPGTNYPIGTPATLDVYYTFNQAGQIATTTYPTTGSQYNQTTNAYTPNTFTYAYDTMGRPNSLKVDSTFANPYSPTGYNWVQNVTYDYAGRRSSLQYWDGNWDGSYMSESKTWNGSGQLASVSFSSYALSGGMQYSYSATQNNGQITQAVDTVSGETIVYQYDLLKRLVSASATPTSGSPSAAWTETFQYDGFGNLTAKVLNGTSTPIPVNAATNQLTNAYYDANGNMTSGAGASFTYDASNRIVSETAVSGGNYGNEYAPDNKRIHQTPSSGTDEWIFYGANGEKLGVYSIGQWYDNNGNAHSVFSPLRTSVWFGGKLIYENGLVYLDRLGTNHAQSAQFLPYGDEITSTSNDRTKFATYTRDSYTGLDYADQRFYASSYGRFMTPDPYMATAKGANDPKNPGSWNRYAYVQGDPINASDPRGLFVEDDEGGLDYDCEECGAPYYIYTTPQQAASQAYEQSLAWFYSNPKRVAAAVQATSAKITAAVQAALGALSSPTCAGLFDLDPNAPAPAALLAQIASGNDPQAYFTEEYIPQPGPNTATNAQTQATSYSIQNGQVTNTGTANNVVVVFNDNPAAPFNTGSVTASAITVLHELGHVYELLYGLGSTNLVNDSIAAQGSVANSNAASAFNTAMVQTNCFP
jgi:RHS repeat-associated protein